MAAFKAVIFLALMVCCAMADEVKEEKKVEVKEIVPASTVLAKFADVRPLVYTAPIAPVAPVLHTAPMIRTHPIVHPYTTYPYTTYPYTHGYYGHPYGMIY